MMIKGLRRTLVVLVTLAATTAVAAQASADTPARVTGVTAADQAAALAYWTPERMRQVGAGSEDKRESVARHWPAAAPKGVGRLFVTDVPGQDSWCTATAVGGDVAITAAHCVWPGYTRDDQRIRAVNVVFVPGYDRGKTPLGIYAARAFLVPESYTQHSSPDVAMIVFSPVAGRHLADAAGNQRLSYDTTAPGRTATFGYPGSKTAYGETLSWCDVPATPDGSSGTWTSTCDMAGGSSGGPWLTGFDPATGAGTVYSVTSKGTLTVDETTGELRTTALFGTTLDGDAQSLYAAAAKL